MHLQSLHTFYIFTIMTTLLFHVNGENREKRSSSGEPSKDPITKPMKSYVGILYGGGTEIH